MNLSDSDDDPFTFNANDNFIQDEINSNIKNNISTEQHYKAFTNIINNTSNKLSEFNNFELNYNWNTYSPQEPISLHYEPMETQTGVFDIIKSDNIFINKVIQVFSILSCETHNILSGGSNSHDNDVLYPLVIYGETQDDDDEDNDKLEDGEAENQISKMLPSLSDLLEKIQKLLSEKLNKSITSLSLAGNKIGYKGMEYLSKCKFLENLISLNLSENNFGKEEMEVFSRCHYLKNLRNLDLSGNHLGKEGMEYLSKCDFLSKLNRLEIRNNNIGKEGMEYLSKAEFLKNVEHLNYNFY